MPQRTNEFQELVARIQRIMAPKGAIVTESAIVGEDEREIDIKIENPEGPYRVKAVEAKDEGRKMDMTSFESYLGKYFVPGGVCGLDKLIIITHRGFSRKVIKRAEYLKHDKNFGIELFTLKEAMRFDWSKFYPYNSFYRCVREVRQINFTLEKGQITKDLCNGRIEYSGKHFGCLKGFGIYVFENIAKKQYRSLLMQSDREVASTGQEKNINLKVPFESEGQPVLVYATDKFVICAISFNIRLYKLEYEKKMPNELSFSFDFSAVPEVCSFELFPQINNIDPKIVEKSGRVIHLDGGDDGVSIMEWLASKISNEYLWAKSKTDPNSILCAQNYSDGRYYQDVIIPFDHNLRIRLNKYDYRVSMIRARVCTMFGQTVLKPKQYELKDKNGGVEYIADMQGTAAGIQFNISSVSGKDEFRIQTRPAKK